MNVHFSSKTNEWSTPQKFFDDLNNEFDFTLDVASTEINAKCPRFYTEKENGLQQDWNNNRVWCNPPYGRTLGQWVKKASMATGGGSRHVNSSPYRHEILPRIYLSETQCRNKIY